MAVPDADADWATCPDYECEPCQFPPNCPHYNFTGVVDIICSYKAQLCEQLRLEHRACRKARGRMCKPVQIKTRTVCTREIDREWGKKCEEEKAKIDAGLADLRAQLAALKKLRGGGDCGCAAPPAPEPEPVTADSFTCGADGEIQLKSDVEAKSSGWFGGGKKSRKERREERRRAREKKMLTDPNPAGAMQASLGNAKNAAAELLGEDSFDADATSPGLAALDGFNAALAELDEQIAELEELIAKLEAKRRANARDCDPNNDAGGMSKHVLNHCREVEEPQLSDRHEEKCAKRTADALAQSAKLQALIEEARRRMALLNGLEEANGGVAAAYTDINLTAPAFTILGNKFVDEGFTNHTRGLMEEMLVNETNLCAEVLPTLQYSILGLGISKEEVWCPTPTGTFIGGRDLPDWAPHFLVGVGLVIGMCVSAFAQVTPAIYAWMVDHPLGCVVAAVVLVAGRFSS
jgi:hypothetical protein